LYSRSSVAGSLPADAEQVRSSSADAQRVQYLAAAQNLRFAVVPDQKVIAATALHRAFENQLHQGLLSGQQAPAGTGGRCRAFYYSDCWDKAVTEELPEHERGNMVFTIGRRGN